mgnify:CR=1 FL=1
MYTLMDKIYQAMDESEVREHVVERLFEYYADEEPDHLDELYTKYVTSEVST